MNFKFRTQVAVALVVIAVSSIIAVFHIMQERRYAHERSLRSSENIQLAFNAIIHETIQVYRFRSRMTLNAPGVVEAIRARDSRKFYSLVQRRFQALQEENPYMSIMQFHAADGRSILRVHLPDRYGDDIASRRAMLRDIHRKHELTAGFEGGVGGIAYRVIIPIFDGTEYVGALEHGIESPHFVKKIKEFTGSGSVVMIHKNWLGAADRDRYSEGIGDFYFTAALNDDKQIMKLFAEQNPNLETKTVSYNAQTFEVNPIFLNDNQGKRLGVIVSIRNVTGANQSINEALIGSLIIALFLVALFWWLFSYAFGALVGKVSLQERYIQTILNSQPNIVIVTDGERIIYANRAFFDYFRIRSLAEFQKEHQCICSFFENEESEQYLMPKIDGVLWTDYLMENSRKEHRAKMTVDGKTSTFSVNSSRMEYKGNIRHVVVFTDITRLNELATRDILTGLANRFQFDKALEHSIHVATRYGRVFSMLLIDIDHFKGINDRYGHLIGDEVLKKLADLLVGNVRKSDLVARWGGEEIAVLLPDSDLEAAVSMAEIIRGRIEEADFAPVERLTCSIGVLQWYVGDGGDNMLRLADEKLYQAKEGGRNRVVS